MTGDKPLVLVTGGNGHIGFRTLVFLLKAGYRVRACVRNTSREQLIRDAESIKTIAPSPADLEFYIVPDLVKDGAYDDAVKDVEYVVHIGGPIAHGDQDSSKFEKELVQPSVKGTMNMLYACEKSPIVKRVVLTSSVAALMSWADWALDENSKVFTESSRTESITGPYEMDWHAYVAAKIDSLNESERWVRAKRPHFDVVNVHPSIVIGAHELAHTKDQVLSGVNFIAVLNIMGQQSNFPLAGATVHIDDCADVLVQSLNKEKVQTEDDGLLSLIAHSHGKRGTVWDDGLDVVRRTWPELVKKGMLPCTGTQPTKKVTIDPTATEKLLGIKFQGFDAQIKNLLEQWIGIVEREGSDIEHLKRIT